jgi:threonine dehydrogenase-like Zn-dependent dehydrogenase
VGDRVALRGSHGTHFTARAAECVHIPDDIDFQDALWYALAKITFMGVLAADYRIGDTLLIVGAGPIGQLSTRWAAASGLEYIVVADPISSRLEMALRGGATGVIDSPIEKSVDQIRLACNGNLPGVVIDSTGNAGVFQAVLGVAADHGRVVILGDTGTPSGQHLTHDVIKRGLTIIGAHDSHNTGGWNDVTVARFFFSMIRRGRVNMGGLITHTFTAKQSATAHDFVSNHRSEVLGVIFDWTN